MPAAAMTDHGNMFGTVDFYRAATSAGVKPIIGCEVYVAPRSRKEKSAVVSDDFDPLAYAVGPGIQGELFNDDGIGANGCNTRLEIGPDVSGPVTLLISSFHEDMGGRFLLRVSDDPPPLESGGCVDFAQEPFGSTTAEASELSSLPAASAGRIRIGTERFGVLDASVGILASGAPAQTWGVAVEQGDWSVTKSRYQSLPVTGTVIEEVADVA